MNAIQRQNIARINTLELPYHFTYYANTPKRHVRDDFEIEFGT